MSEKKPEPSTKSDKVDEELADLLDSALEDFNKDTAGNKEPKTEPKPAELEESAVDAPVEWSDDFIRQAAAQFESNLANLLGGTPDGGQLTPEQLQQKLAQMAEAAQQVIDNPTINQTSTDFASTISQTVQGLTAGAEGLQTPFNEQDIMGMFAGGGGPADQQNAFLPFMQGMMQSLLSKDVLYPSLKDILDKFPEWLENNKSTLSKEDAERYENQRKLMEDVCKELESEQESDSIETKRERFERVLQLMQKLQDYGQPPTELVGDAGPPLPDMQSNDPNQCNVM